MPSDVDICNLALSYIGDVADVQSISPPDGSVQAGFCSHFFPIARKTLLEQHTWNFATFRVNLAQLQTNPSTTWAYAYAVPDGMLTAISVLSPYAIDDYAEQIGEWGGAGPWGMTPATGGSSATPTPSFAGFEDWSGMMPAPWYPNPADVEYTPQPFTIETDANGNPILLTNVCNAILRYTVNADNPNQFSSLFVMALSYQLASMLAGPLIKGDTGMQVSAGMMAKAAALVSQAATSDANQRRLSIKQRVPWMAER